MSLEDVRVLHDGGWIHPGGGARVALELAKAFDAPITVGHTAKPDWWEQQPVDVDIAFNEELHESWLAKLTSAAGLQPVAELRLGQLFGSLDLEEEIVISSGTAAKWWCPKWYQTHVHYCHVPPPRFYGESSVGSPVKWAMRLGGGMADQHYAGFVDEFLANSEFTRDRIQKHYDSEAAVLNPPIRTDSFEHREPTEDRYLVHIGRLNQMKRAELVAKAVEPLDCSLVMIGDGPLKDTCESYDGVSVYPDLPDWLVEQAVANSSGGVAFAEKEHCGLTPKEFQTAGKPVAVPDEPNLCNHVADGETGVITAVSVEGLRTGLRRLLNTEWDRDRIQASAESWSAESFQKRARNLVLGGIETEDANKTGAAPAVARPDGGHDD